MTLDQIEATPGSGQYGARYIHKGKHDFRVQIWFKDGSNRRFTGDKVYRTKTQLLHDWHRNRYKFYQYNFTEVK